MKDAVKIVISKLGAKAYLSPYWQVKIVGASGRSLIADTLRNNRNYYGQWYESETFTGVGFRTLADARTWYAKNLYQHHQTFVQAERCSVCTETAHGVDADCLAECWARLANHDPEERIRIRLKG